MTTMYSQNIMQTLLASQLTYGILVINMYITSHICNATEGITL